MRKKRKHDDITILNTYSFENEIKPLFSYYVLESIDPLYTHFFHSGLAFYQTRDIIYGGFEIYDGDKSYALSKTKGDKKDGKSLYLTTALYSRCKYACKTIGLGLEQIV